VPPWFSNLLPEGPLRTLVAEQAGVSPGREFFLLRQLGEDLPGAVRILGDLPDREAEERAAEMSAESGGKERDSWHFSLAGVQLKFSAHRNQRGLTVPVSGRGGDWIVKLPDARYPRVPENEHATMRWARESGISIPEIELVDVENIEGLPHSLHRFQETLALVVRRFDRRSDGSRIHMEDFAQVLDVYPEEKYSKYNYETLASIIFALTGLDGLAKFVHQLVFIVSAGNGDAHHKNWTLLYRDGIQAELSPAYDLVTTIPYQAGYQAGDTLALNLAKSKRWGDVDMGSFVRLARRIKVEEIWMVEQVTLAAERIWTAWKHSSEDFGYDVNTREILNNHLSRIPLLNA